MKMSRIESAIRLVLAYYEALNRQDLTIVDAQLSEDFSLESAGPPPDGTVTQGREAVMQEWREVFRHRPLLHYEIDEVFGMGHRCVARWRCVWNNAAGDEETIRGVDIFAEQNGRLTAQYSFVKGDEPGS